MIPSDWYLSVVYNMIITKILCKEIVTLYSHVLKNGQSCEQVFPCFILFMLDLVAHCGSGIH